MRERGQSKCARCEAGRCSEFGHRRVRPARRLARAQALHGGDRPIYVVVVPVDKKTSALPILLCKNSSSNPHADSSSIIDYYRCPEPLLDFELSGPLSADEGFFSIRSKHLLRPLLFRTPPLPVEMDSTSAWRRLDSKLKSNSPAHSFRGDRQSPARALRSPCPNVTKWGKNTTTLFDHGYLLNPDKIVKKMQLTGLAKDPLPGMAGRPHPWRISATASVASHQSQCQTGSRYLVLASRRARLRHDDA